LAENMGDLPRVALAVAASEAEFKGLARQVAQLQGHAAPSYAILEETRCKAWPLEWYEKR